MKKTILSIAMMATMVAGTLVSCDKSAKEEPVAPAAKAGEMKAAYVELDSIMTQYQFCKDQEQALTKEGQRIDGELQKKQNDLQAAANSFQQKIQQNAMTQQQAQATQASLQKQAQDLEVLRQRLATEFQQKQADYQKALNDSVNHFLAAYNKDKKYSVIYAKSGLLYADQSMDITKEVVAGLNKAYKPAAKEEKK